MDSEETVGTRNSIALDSSDKVHISYYGSNSNRGLKYARAVPTHLTATPAIGEVTLSWDSVPGAIGYNVYVSTTSGSEFTQVNTVLVTGTTYTIPNLIGNVTYYIYITYVIDGDEFLASPEVSVIPSLGGGDGSEGCFIAIATGI